MDSFSGKYVAIKANYNSATLPSIHYIETLRAIVENINAAGAERITLAERSGMGDTREVLERMGVFALSKELGFEAIVLDDEKDGG